MGDLKFLIHNLVAHPIAGVCWFVGLEKLGNAAHSICEPEPFFGLEGELNQPPFRNEVRDFDPPVPPFVRRVVLDEREIGEVMSKLDEMNTRLFGGPR
jgi:hypothetical protein